MLSALFFSSIIIITHGFVLFRAKIIERFRKPLSTMEDDRFSLPEASNDEEEEDSADELTTQDLLKKKKKHGIIYISSIPKFMTVSILREFLSEHAKVGRIYLQANSSGQKSGKDEGNHSLTSHSP